MSPPGPSRAERIARNRAIAERFYDGYHGSVERGRLTNVFEPEDFADEWVFCSPFLGGETHQRPNRDLADGAVANHAVIWQKIPDYKMDHLMVWPTERGCAWRWCVHGTGTDGKHYEFWEQLFLWTDVAGKVTRFEFYDDWHGFPQALVFAYGLSLDEFTRIDDYGLPPWNPGPAMSIDPPAAPPRDDPPANARVARNPALARQYFDGYHHSLERGGLHGVFAEDDLAEGWVLFSPGSASLHNQHPAWRPPSPGPTCDGSASGSPTTGWTTSRPGRPTTAARGAGAPTAPTSTAGTARCGSTCSC